MFYIIFNEKKILNGYYDEVCYYRIGNIFYYFYLLRNMFKLGVWYLKYFKVKCICS